MAAFHTSCVTPALYLQTHRVSDRQVQHTCVPDDVRSWKQNQVTVNIPALLMRRSSLDSFLRKVSLK